MVFTCVAGLVVTPFLLQAWTERASDNSEFFGQSDGGEWDTLDSADYSSDAEDSSDSSDPTNISTDEDSNRPGGAQGLISCTAADDSAAAGYGPAHDSSTATTKWTPGMSASTTITPSSSSGSGTGGDTSSEANQDATFDVFGELEFSIPPRLPAAAATHKQHVAAAPKARKTGKVEY